MEAESDLAGRPVSCTLTEPVIKYRRIVGAYRGINLRELDNDVWQFYIRHHPAPTYTEVPPNRKEQQ